MRRGSQNRNARWNGSPWEGMNHTFVVDWVSWKNTTVVLKDGTGMILHCLWAFSIQIAA